MSCKIEANELCIEFPLYHLTTRSLKKNLLAHAHRRLRMDLEKRVVVAALQDINLTINSGERVALVGGNGAGKTTLLRTLAGIYEPTAGRLNIKGRIGTMIDPAAGLDPWSTGRENIRLRGLYLGLSPEEIAQLEEDVEVFADLGEFIDVPINSYSSGMSIRLAFGIATAIHPKILLMDEWISAGDADFVAKAEARLVRLVDAAEILVLASHNMAIVERWCHRMIRLERGRIVADLPLNSNDKS